MTVYCFVLCGLLNKIKYIYIYIHIFILKQNMVYIFCNLSYSHLDFRCTLKVEVSQNKTETWHILLNLIKLVCVTEIFNLF